MILQIVKYLKSLFKSLFKRKNERCFYMYKGDNEWYEFDLSKGDMQDAIHEMKDDRAYKRYVRTGGIVIKGVAYEINECGQKL